MDSSFKALHRNIAEWLAGPTGALIFHVLLILALLCLVDLSPKKKPVKIYEVTVSDDQILPLEKELTPLKMPHDDIASSEPDNLSPPDFQAEPFVFPLDVDVFNPQVPPLRADQDIPDIPSPLIVQNLMPGDVRSRFGEKAHAESGALFGGPGWESAEDSVRRALEWLRLHQNPDGSWGTQDSEALAGLGLLTYLAHGETTASDRYGQTVTRALHYLLARQNDRGEFCKTDTTAGTYGQAICVYALSEAYGMTRIPALKSVMEKGVQVLIDGQQPRGGFDYKFAKGALRDTSLCGWCCQAMKAAYIAGAENPKLHDAMELAVADLKSVQKTDDGSFYYSGIGASHSTHSITAVAVLSMQLLGHGEDPEVQRGLNFLESAECNWKNPPEWPMYAWYYIAQAKFHEGGADWRRWNNQFAPQFIRNQNADGSWTSAGLGLKAGIVGRENMHPAYATTLAALTLQVYYRLLPTFKPVPMDKPDQKSDDDVQIRVL